MEELPKPPKLPGGRRHDEVFNPNKLFVGGLSKDTTQKQFRQYWEKWGQLEDCVVMVDPHTQKSRGFGFVVFTSQSIAPDILSQGDTLTMHGRKLDIKKAVPRKNNVSSRRNTHSHSHSHSHSQAPPPYDRRMYSPHPHPRAPRPGPPYYAHPHPHPHSHPVPPPHSAYSGYPPPAHHNFAPDRSGYRASYDRYSRRDNYNRDKRTKYRKRTDKLFIGGLGESFTDETLDSYFSKYGAVEDVVVMVDKEGNSRRFGFVTFVHREDSNLVLNDGKHVINGVKVTIERAIPKDKMGDAAPRRDHRRDSQRDDRSRDRYSPRQRFDDPYYRYHPSHGPPPPPIIYSPPPPPPPPSYIYPPPHSSHMPAYAHPPHPHNAYLPPRPPPYYQHPHPHPPPPRPGVPTSAPPKPPSAATAASTAAAPRYHYTYTHAAPPPVAIGNAIKAPDGHGASKQSAAGTDIKREDKKTAAVVSNVSVSGISGYGMARPVHTAAQYGTYKAAQTYSNTAYGGQRGAVSATKTYNPY